MDPSILPLNKKVDSAVKEYAEALVQYVKKISPDVEILVEEELATDEGKNCSASIIDLQTEYAFVTIFPDFRKQSARAALLNRGLIFSMELEGFDEETINKSPIYGSLMPFNVDNLEVFAIVLTRDLGMQHQKILETKDEE